LLLSASRTPKELLLRSAFLAGAAPAESEEDCSGGVLEPRWSNLFREKLGFPHVVSFDEIAPREILLLEKSWAKGSVETTFKLKINLIRINSNFSSF
jgi:hypothetical protein